MTRNTQVKPSLNKKKRPQAVPSSSSEEELSVVLTDSDSAEEEIDQRQAGPPSPSKLTAGDHVLVQYKTKKSAFQYYVGVIDSVMEDGRLRMSFLRKKKESAAQFIYPDQEDNDEIDSSMVILIRCTPITVGGTNRTVKSVMFTVDLSTYTIQ